MANALMRTSAHLFLSRSNNILLRYGSEMTRLSMGRKPWMIIEAKRLMSSSPKEEAEGNDSRSNNYTEWIPPPQMIHQDDYDEENSSSTSESLIKEATVSVDWLETRRSKLSSSDSAVGDHHHSSLLMTPSQGILHKQEASDSTIVVKEYTLLSRDEIASCLVALGGRSISVILDNPEQPRMGGATGMMLATAATFTQLQSLADGLVRQLRRRRLHERGVLGAELGVEGAKNDPHETWLVVDCKNYIVHLLDETTRRCLKLEDLWSGKDGLHRLDLLDEDAIDEYVYENPVPDEYISRSIDMDDTLRQLEKIRWTAHTPVVKKAKGKRNTRRRKN